MILPAAHAGGRDGHLVTTTRTYVPVVASSAQCAWQAVEVLELSRTQEFTEQRTVDVRRARCEGRHQLLEYLPAEDVPAEFGIVGGVNTSLPQVDIRYQHDVRTNRG